MGKTRALFRRAFGRGGHPGVGEARDETGVGRLLCSTRMRLGKDLQHIAQVLHIRYTYLVAIEDGRIVGLDKAAKRSAGDEAIDVAGLWLIPGLIDCHVHITQPTDNGDPRAAASRASNRLPCTGVKGTATSSLG